MRHVKLTDENHETRGGTLWRPGKEVSVRQWCNPDAPLCGPGWLHSYRANTTREAHALAVLMAPCHGVSDAVAWVATPAGHQRHEPTKSGSERLTVWRRLPRLEVTTEQRVEVAIRVALAVPGNTSDFEQWAHRWLSGEDRSKMAAEEAEKAEGWWPSWAAWWAAQAAARAAQAAEEAEAWWATQVAAAQAAAARAAQAQVAAARAAQAAEEAAATGAAVWVIAAEVFFR